MRERAAANRQALARLVDLQWAFFRGVSLDGCADEGRIDLEDLTAKMGGLRETLESLIGQVSFGEGLLRKVVAVLAFSTLGASNRGRLMDADGLEAKRESDPLWNEGIVMTNQALAFSFLLGVCATLANNVDAVLSKKDAGKLGSIRSLSPLLLGLRFATALYEGECPWFHGLPFFPGAGGTGNDRMEGSSIHAMCKRSHVELWTAVATMANRIDALPAKRGAGRKGDDIADVKEYAEYVGYIPFASFLGSAAGGRNGKIAKYAAAEDVIEALSEKKHEGAVKGTEADTWQKLNLVLLIADNNTKGEDEEDGEYFLSKNPETNKREFIAPVLPDEEVKVPDGTHNEERVSEVPVPPPDEETENMEKDKATGELKEEEASVPLKTTYSERGMALLTPAALLAGAGDAPQNKSLVDVAGTNKGADKSPLVLPVDSILAPSITESNLGTATNGGVDSLLTNTLPSGRHQEPSTAAPLLPPPGFSVQSQRQNPSLPLPFTGPNITGISLAEFTAPVPPQRTDQIAAPYGLNQSSPPGMMPQAGPSNYPASSMPETMNPFAQAQLSFVSNNAIIPGASSGANGSGLLNTVTQGSGVNLQQHALKKGGLDPTLDFLLNSNSPIPTPGQLLGSSNALDLLTPPMATAVRHEQEDPAESIMKFLFDPGNDAQSRSGQPLYANPGGLSTSQHHDMPQTKNPFAR